MENLTWNYDGEGQLFQATQPKLYYKDLTNSIRRVMSTSSILVRTHPDADLDFQHKLEIYRRFLQTVDIVGRVLGKMLH